MSKTYEGPDLRIEIQPWWSAGGVTLRRTIKAPAENAEQARQRMREALALVWKEFTFLTPPLKEAE